ncbi:hypothetical protein P12x_004645 [Tundrisphaera lichenicola]|uniref:hypothetical protein n=1 Tax=Tundrisphaera lichenicola TaxID=2029860 RepID=UPI003EC02049
MCWYVLALHLASTTLGMVSGEPGAFRVSGVVIGSAGKPAGGAELWIASKEWGGEPPTILGQAVADEQGRFSIELATSDCLCDLPTLWAYKKGSVAASTWLTRADGTGQPVRLVMGSPARTEFLVVGPDGRPVPNARILPWRLSRDNLAVPGILAERSRATTDPDGRAILEAFRPEEVVVVRVEADGYGTQVRRFQDPDGQAESGIKDIILNAPGKVTGRVVGDDPEAVSGLEVRVISSVAGLEREGTEIGIADAVTDPSGQFVVDAIAAGVVSVHVLPRPGSPELPVNVGRRRLEPGQTVSVEIPLRRGVQVKGIALDSRDGQPIAGALVAVVPTGRAGLSTVWTDAQGRYETFVPPGQATHRVLRVPRPYLCPPDFLRQKSVDIPIAIGEFELPPISLIRGVQLRGSVVDDRSKPVAGAKVQASWLIFDGRFRAPKSVISRSRADGSFAIGPVDPEVEVTLTADLGPLASTNPVVAKASEARPIVLTVAGSEATSPAGRVVDLQGRPVPGALVRIWELADSTADGGSIVLFDGDDHLKTDLQGRFAGPSILRRDREYRAMAHSERFGEGRTRPITPDRSGVLTFPEIVLAREPKPFVIAGRVLDRQGRPIEGASVWTVCEGPNQRPSRTGPDGRFLIEELREGCSFLFAQAEGFRFSGRAIAPSTNLQDLTLTRLGEAPDRVMKTRRVATSPIRAREILSSYVERVLSEGDQATRVQTLEHLARIDPERVLTLVESRDPSEAWYSDHLRLVAVRELIRSNFTEEVRSAISAIRDHRYRAEAEIAVADALPANAPSQKREWVELALADSQTIHDPSNRVIALSQVVSRMMALGELDRASRLLNQSSSLVESLPLANLGGRARATFAEVLAKVEPDRAQDLAGELIDPDLFNRCHLNLAGAIAEHNPARASEILGRLRAPAALRDSLPSICHAMARVDPDRAHRLALRVRSDAPCVSAYSLGMMALAVADVKKSEATAWLRESFDLLAGRAASPLPSSETTQVPAAVAAALLPVVERVDPNLVPEFFWRAVSFHKPSVENQAEATFAMLLARYDRSTGLAFLESLVSRSLSTSVDDLEPLLDAAVVIDPALAARLVDGLPDPPDLSFHHPKNVARLAYADALARPAPGCWDEVTVKFLHLWLPGYLGTD